MLILRRHSMLLQWSHNEEGGAFLGSTLRDSILGPVFGMDQQLAKFHGQITSGGDWVKATEYLVPKFLRDISRTWRYSTDGMTTFNGDVIAKPSDLDTMDLVWKVLGFAPSSETDIYSGKGYVDRVKMRLKNQKQRLIRKWRDAGPAERNRIWRNEIAEFNRSLDPRLRAEYMLNYSSLVRSATSQIEREAWKMGGADTTPLTRGFVQQEIGFLDL